MPQDLTAPDAGTCQFEVAQQVPRTMQEPSPKMIGQIPKGHVLGGDKARALVSAFLIHPPSNSQAQLAKQRKIAEASRNASPFEFEDVPGREMMQQSAERRRLLAEAADQHNVGRPRRIADRQIGLDLVMLLDKRPEHFGEQRMPLHYGLTVF